MCRRCGGNSLTRALTSDALVEERRRSAAAPRRDRRRCRWRRCADRGCGSRPRPTAACGRTSRRRGRRRPCRRATAPPAIWPLVIAISSGVMPFGSAAFRSAPASTSSARRVERAVARGEQQRRHAAGRRQLLALRRHAAADDADAVRAAAGAGRTRRRLGADARARLDRRAAREQQLHDRRRCSVRTAHISAVWPSCGSAALTSAPASTSSRDRVDAAGADRRHQQRVAGCDRCRSPSRRRRADDGGSPRCRVRRRCRSA